jgi:hypothetical protein
MKGVIIGSDLLEHNGDVKFLEINTNTTIYNRGADMLDYDGLFSTLSSSGVTEFHYIWTETDAFTPLYEPYRFKQILKERCSGSNISFAEYVVPYGSITVPYIEDSANKFILRQSYDTTALVDETYCADKFEFFNLMHTSEYIPQTCFETSEINFDTLGSVDYTSTSNPNILIKARYPNYDKVLYPELHTISNQSELDGIKANLPDNYLVQEFVYSDDNLVDGKYSIIRSIDILYGPNLDVINMGGYRQSTIIPISKFENEFISGSTKLDQKSRYKYITKVIDEVQHEYHTDEDSMIVDYTGSLQRADTIHLGSYIRSIDFVDFNGNHGANFEEGKLDVLGWESTLQQSRDTLTQLTSSLNHITSASVDTMFIRVTLTDGRNWIDSPACTYYIEESGSTSTRFELLNKMYVGDKIVITNAETSELTTLEIAGLEMEHAKMTVYALDFEPSDLFLVDLGGDNFGVMHNPCWCPWSSCGDWCFSSYCPGCGGGGFRVAKR